MNPTELKQQVSDFIKWAKPQLGLTEPVKVKLVKVKQNQGNQFSFGSFDPETKQIVVAYEGRHILDIFRSICHEMIHLHQLELNQLTDGSGNTGSEQENEANAFAGVLMRLWNNKQT